LDDTEKIVESLLSSAGHICAFEPNGNVPPDFLLDGQVAVEVRRLNQNFVQGTEYEGLETAEASIFSRMQYLLQTFGPPIDDQSWWISYTISRPMPKWKEIERRLRPFLADIASSMPEDQKEIEFSGGFSVDAMPANIRLSQLFQIGGYNDFQAGGFVVAELIENINLCIAEKTRKIARVADRYSEWWLVLVDFTKLGPDREDLEQLREHVLIPSMWKRVAIVSPDSPDQAFWIR
jgi:hypothetical protein